MSYANKSQRNNLKNLLLEVYRAGSELTLIFHLPGETPYFMRPYMIGHELDEKKFDRVIRDLKRKEYISTAEKEGEITLYLTKDGERRALRYSLDEMKIERPHIWDGKWRMILFDIPDSKKAARNFLTDKLQELGFIQLQKSVYAHPFHCEDQVELIRSVLGIEPFVKIALVDTFDGEDKSLSKFGLSKIKI